MRELLLDILDWALYLLVLLPGLLPPLIVITAAAAFVAIAFRRPSENTERRDS